MSDISAMITGAAVAYTCLPVFLIYMGSFINEILSIQYMCCIYLFQNVDNNITTITRCTE